MPADTDLAAADGARTLQRAMDAHAAGRFDEAEQAYAQLLQRVPQQADALHLLGVLQAQRGRLERAAELIAAAIGAQPHEAMFHNNYGNICLERGQLDAAEASYLRAIELDPARLDALNNLGILLGRRGKLEDSEKVLAKVVELAPGYADARQNLANLYLRMGRVGDAVQQCIDGLILSPRDPMLRRVLGMAYTSLGLRDEAIAVWRAWLAVEPDNPLPRFHLLACTGERMPERAPDDYVTRVFDRFAHSFDAKLAQLGYRAPALVAEAVARHAGPPAGTLELLDAGCGTGLCGPLLAPWARRLEGVDLSQGMLQQARERGVYQALEVGELVAHLRAHAGAWDLVASADTLCYFGPLEAFAAAAHQALRPGGLLVFTVEAHADEAGQPDCRLQANARYSHRAGYVDAVLRGAGFTPLEATRSVLRSEAGVPVQGLLLAARA